MTEPVPDVVRNMDAAMVSAHARLGRTYSHELRQAWGALRPIALEGARIAALLDGQWDADTAPPLDVEDPPPSPEEIRAERLEAMAEAREAYEPPDPRDYL